MQTRRWGGRRGSKRASVIRKVRGALTAELGRTPVESEMLGRLRGLVTNPNFYIGDEAKMLPMSDFSRKQNAAARNISEDATPAVQRVMDADTIRLASKGLNRLDRKILKMLLAGESHSDIARQLGIGNSTVRDRANGLLWEARCRADLAAHLGVEPATMPAKDRQSRLPLITKQPPAGRAKSA
jgi:DNA-directed RNA polymerase specialized sigma subunit